MPEYDSQLMMENRTTSAGYRLPIQRPPSSSEYHNKCAPPPQHRAPAASTKTGGTTGVAAVDVVTNDKIWRQNLHKEKNGARQWYVCLDHDNQILIYLFIFSLLIDTYFLVYFCCLIL